MSSKYGVKKEKKTFRERYWICMNAGYIYKQRQKQSRAHSLWYISSQNKRLADVQIHSLIYLIDSSLSRYNELQCITDKIQLVWRLPHLLLNFPLLLHFSLTRHLLWNKFCTPIPVIMYFRPSRSYDLCATLIKLTSFGTLQIQ